MEYTVELEKEEIKGNKEIAYILLKSKVPYFVDTDVKVEESTVSITSIIKESYQKVYFYLLKPFPVWYTSLVNVTDGCY